MNPTDWGLVVAWTMVGALLLFNLVRDVAFNDRPWNAPLDEFWERAPFQPFVVSRRAFVLVWRPIGIAVAAFVVHGLATGAGAR